MPRTLNPRVLAAAAFTGLALLISVGSASSQPARATADIPATLYFVYTMNCTFSIVDDAGQPISSIAPGTWQVNIRTPVPFGAVPVADLTDFTACKGSPDFHLSGPGVNLFTTMTVGCQSDVNFQVKFSPNATYLAVDQNQPLVARGSFSTTATAAPVRVPSTYVNTTPIIPTTEESLLGGSDSKAVGTGTAQISRNGTPTLRLEAKTGSKLKPGRYIFTIADNDTKTGFLLVGPKSSHPTNLTGVKYVGTKQVAVKLTAGRWAYYTALKNIKYFVIG